MSNIELSTEKESTWCPGCHNFLLLAGVKKALQKIIKGGTKQESIVMSTGIGCHGKMFDYLKIGGVYSLHGRVIPTCWGMKLGNPNLTVIGFGGDGDTYAEGTAHFIHACRCNPDMTMIVHNNQNFALTTGQGTPTSEKGYQSKSQPMGVVTDPFNPIKMALCAGATFVSRVYPKNMEHTAKVLESAIKHKGFSLVDAIIPCLVYHKNTPYLEKHIYKLEDHPKTDMKKALEKAEEWNYNLEDKKIPLGIFYQKEKKTLGDKFPQTRKLKKKGMGWWQINR